MINSPFDELRVNNVDPVTFIAGASQYFYFDLYDDNGNPYDANTLSDIKLNISPYGNPDKLVVSLTGYPIYQNRIMFYLYSLVTTNLSGVYVHQLVLTDGSGLIHKPTQGLITIIPKIGNN